MKLLHRIGKKKKENEKKEKKKKKMEKIKKELKRYKLVCQIVRKAGWGG